VRAALREALAIDRDEWLTLDRAAGLAGTSPRALRDAGRRGELTIAHAGRRPVVSRGELDRWITSRPVAPRHTVDDPHADVRAAVQRATERARRGGR
jgi:hypothetical protein